MKAKFFLWCISLALFTSQARAQWAVIDPTNLAQGIINTTRQIVETSATASRMLQNFQETVKIYEQAKGYYDALKAVNNLVRDARKVQKTMLLVGEISDIYVVNFQKMLSDPNFTALELNAIAAGYLILLEESGIVLDQLKTVVNISTLSLSDKERMDVVDECYRTATEYRNLVQYYTGKNIGVSYLRAKKKKETDRVVALYGQGTDKYW